MLAHGDVTRFFVLNFIGIYSLSGENRLSKDTNIKANPSNCEFQSEKYNKSFGLKKLVRK